MYVQCILYIHITVTLFQNVREKKKNFIVRLSKVVKTE